MRHKFLPSFVKRRGRITRSQEKNLDLLPNYLVTTGKEIDDISKDFQKTILEIGFGNGGNILSLAKNNPETLFVGSEVYLAGIGYLLGEMVRSKIANIRINTGDIRLLIETIDELTFDEMLIICPDPWPKAKHHKRRLINEDFFKLVYPTIKDHGVLFISTDWEEYAESIEESIGLSNGYQRESFSSYEESKLTKFQERAVKEGRRIFSFPLTKKINSIV